MYGESRGKKRYEPLPNRPFDAGTLQLFPSYGQLENGSITPDTPTLIAILATAKTAHSEVRTVRQRAEKPASRIAGGFLFILAAFVVTASVLMLLGHVEARPSPIGIALLVLAAMIMPSIAAQKRQQSTTTASAALRADAAESAVCGYLALMALAGLAVNAVWKVGWADPVAALALLPMIVREGWEARKGKPRCH